MAPFRTSRLVLLLAPAIAAGGVAGPAGLDDLPAYRPASVSGVIRIFGNPMAGLELEWEKGFIRFQPGVRFEDRFDTGEGAVAGLLCGVSDLGPSGREPAFTEIEAVYDAFPDGLVDLTVATGPYDVRTTWSVVVFVNRANPISRLSLRQLDGIFGAERTGGFRGYRWTPEAARSAKDDIRTWGQVGLTGDWAAHPIQTYGYTSGGSAAFFQQKVFGGGEKWNPNYREYVETGSKMIVDTDAGRALGIDRMLGELSDDRFGIAWTGMPQGSRFPRVKALALSESDGGPYVEPSLQSVRDRTYPLTRSVFMFLKRMPGQPVEPKVKEYLRYILSREGQEDVARNGKYLPLTAAVAEAQLKRLD